MKRNIPVDLHNFKQSEIYPCVGFSDDCRIINWNTKSIINTSLSNGYYSLMIKYEGKNRKVLLHRLIAERFVKCEGDFSLYVVNHKDGNKANNSVDNLEWITNSENIKHANRIGLRDSCKGFNHHSCITTEEDVRKACGYMSLHLSNKEVESIVGLPTGFCNDIRRGKIWQDIFKEYPIPVKTNKATLFYIMSLDDEYLKFGRTNNIDRRLIETRFISKPFKVKLLNCFDVGCPKLARQLEVDIKNLVIQTSGIDKSELPRGYSETTHISSLPLIIDHINNVKPA